MVIVVPVLVLAVLVNAFAILLGRRVKAMDALMAEAAVRERAANRSRSQAFLA